jgi:hypothetical protein
VGCVYLTLTSHNALLPLILLNNPEAGNVLKTPVHDFLIFTNVKY